DPSPPPASWRRRPIIEFIGPVAMFRVSRLVGPIDSSPDRKIKSVIFSFFRPARIAPAGGAVPYNLYTWARTRSGTREIPAENARVIHAHDFRYDAWHPACRAGRVARRGRQGGHRRRD